MQSSQTPEDWVRSTLLSLQWPLQMLIVQGNSLRRHLKTALNILPLLTVKFSRYQILDSEEVLSIRFLQVLIIISHKIPHRIFPAKEEVGCKLSYLYDILGGAYSTPYFCASYLVHSRHLINAVHVSTLMMATGGLAMYFLKCLYAAGPKLWGF